MKIDELGAIYATATPAPYSVLTSTDPAGGWLIYCESKRDGYALMGEWVAETAREADAHVYITLMTQAPLLLRVCRAARGVLAHLEYEAQIAGKGLTSRQAVLKRALADLEKAL